MRLSKVFLTTWLLIGWCLAQTITLTAPTPRQEASFGRYIAVVGDHLLVSERNEDDIAVTDIHVFSFNQGLTAPIHQFSIDTPQPTGPSPYSIQIAAVDSPAGALLLVAVPHQDVTLSQGTFAIGEMTVYRNNGTEEAPLYGEVSRLHAPELAHRVASFGGRLAVQSRENSVELVVGVPFIATTDYTQATSKVIRYRSSDGVSWDRLQEIDAADLGENPRFGNTLTLAGNRLFIGAASANGPSRTGIFRYEPDPKQPDQWVQTGLFLPSALTYLPAVDFDQPIHVLDNGFFVIGAPFAAYNNQSGRIFVFDGSAPAPASNYLFPIQSLFPFGEGVSSFGYVMTVLPDNGLLIPDITIPDNDTVRQSTQEFRLINDRFARIGNVRSRYGVEPYRVARSFQYHVAGNTPYLIENFPTWTVNDLYAAGEVRVHPLVRAEAIQGEGFESGSLGTWQAEGNAPAPTVERTARYRGGFGLQVDHHDSRLSYQAPAPAPDYHAGFYLGTGALDMTENRHITLFKAGSTAAVGFRIDLLQVNQTLWLQGVLLHDDNAETPTQAIGLKGPWHAVKTRFVAADGDGLLQLTVDQTQVEVRGASNAELATQAVRLGAMSADDGLEPPFSGALFIDDFASQTGAPVRLRCLESEAFQVFSSEWSAGSVLHLVGLLNPTCQDD